MRLFLLGVQIVPGRSPLPVRALAEFWKVNDQADNSLLGGDTYDCVGGSTVLCLPPGFSAT